ncbi:MAG: GTP cyclohydrolase I FolE [Acidobacteriota bacterium]|jgi:GTP cyclohydrolase I|nr:GTP cyclohydrolase I FolE [Acidobacteriota bacterium]
MKSTKMDAALIRDGVRLILQGIGEDPDSLRLQQTPRRVAEMFAEVLSGTHEDTARFSRLLTEEKHNEMVMLKNIAIHSMCEHHLLPFSGTASVVYIPDKGRIMGLNTIAGLVDTLARRLQIQERLTKQIADCLVDILEPMGVMVVIQAEHLCMTMRGAKKPGSRTITSAVRGVFKNATTRQEAMSLIMSPV